MRAIEERLRPYTNEHPSLFRLEKWLQTHAGKYPPIFFSLYRLMRNDPARVVTPDTQLVIEGFPRSANTFARVAFSQAQSEKVRLAYGLHVPAQILRAARWQIPALVLIRKPEDAILSFAIRDPILLDQALRYYLSFYETVEKCRDAYVLGHFEEAIEDFGQVIRRINDKFGTRFSPFRHNERNVERVFARIERNSRRRYGESYWQTKVSSPSAAKEKIKHELEYKLENPKRRKLLAEAEAVYERLTNPVRNAGAAPDA